MKKIIVIITPRLRPTKFIVEAHDESDAYNHVRLLTDEFRKINFKRRESMTFDYIYFNEPAANKVRRTLDKKYEKKCEYRLSNNPVEFCGLDFKAVTKRAKYCEVHRSEPIFPKKLACICTGCPKQVPEWWASGMCYGCVNEDCEHPIPGEAPGREGSENRIAGKVD